MKKRINLTIDDDLYGELDNLPRGISVSEIVNYLLRVFVEELKQRKELSTEELRALAREMPSGDDFVRRMDETFGPKVDKVKGILEKLREKVKGKNEK